MSKTLIKSNKLVIRHYNEIPVEFSRIIQFLNYDFEI